MAKRNTKSDRLKDAGVLNPQAERVLAPEFQIDTFFDPRDLLQVKYEMLRMVRQEGATKAEAAERFGLSRPTLYQAQAAYDRDGLVGLLPRQRGPKGAHKLDARIMAFIDSHIDEGGPIQARRLALLVEAEFGLQVHPRSIERALQRKKTPTEIAPVDLPPTVISVYESLRSQVFNGGSLRTGLAAVCHHGMLRGLQMLSRDTTTSSRSVPSRTPSVPTNDALVRQLATMILNVQAESRHAY